MSHNLPFEDYIAEEIQEAIAPTPHRRHTFLPGGLSTSEPDSNSHQQYDSSSPYSESTSSQLTVDDPDALSTEISPLEHRAVEFHDMARLDDESGQESECGDDYGGGVPLADHESMMELDGHASEWGWFEGTLDQDSPAVGDSTKSLESSHEQVNHNLDTDNSTSLDAYAMSPAQEYEDQAPEHEAAMPDWPYWSPQQSHHASPNTAQAAEATPSQAAHIWQSLPVNVEPSPPTSDPNLYTFGPSTSLNISQTVNSIIAPAQSNSPASDTGQSNDTTPDQANASSNALLDPDPDPSVSFDLDPSNELNQQPVNWFTTTATHAPQNQLMFSIFYNQQTNMPFLECLRFWLGGHNIQERRLPKPVDVPDLFPRIRYEDIAWGMQKRKNKTVTSSDVDEGTYDHQGIDWKAFRLDRSDARRMRSKTYCNNTNVIHSHPYRQEFNNWPMFVSARDMNLDARDNARHLANSEKYFRFSRMSLQHQICIPHFQLRHIISASSKNAIFFPTASHDHDDYYVQTTTGSQITNLNPDVEDDSYNIDSAHSDPNQDDNPRMGKIYALSAKNDILVAGGLEGEYAYKSLSSVPTAPFTSGMMTVSEYSSTNHVHTYLDRRSGLPRAVFSSNDNNVHVLDVTTNKFLSRHDHIKCVNCAATSPDTRLRVLVRDAIHPLIVEADTGKRIAKLSGHSDFGFACDWSDDGVHFATAAQDGLVQIYDMRSWRKPLTTLLADLGGVRCLAFSPQGGGKQHLLMGESADFVHIVDASRGMFDRKQTVDFFGEIAGLSWDEDSGRRFWVGVGDPDVGGVMEFERCEEGRFGRRSGRGMVKEWRDAEGEGREEERERGEESRKARRRRRRRGRGLEI
ncbi:MAG: hypothetical protein Q9166_002587 [cf. Caloplaca sp. 2 TL-2023]